MICRWEIDGASCAADGAVLKRPAIPHFICLSHMGTQISRDGRLICLVFAAKGETTFLHLPLPIIPISLVWTLFLFTTSSTVIFFAHMKCSVNIETTLAPKILCCNGDKAFRSAHVRVCVWYRGMHVECLWRAWPKTAASRFSGLYFPICRKLFK